MFEYVAQTVIPTITHAQTVIQITVTFDFNIKLWKSDLISILFK